MSHDIYYEFIRTSVADDRLTFGLAASFAFIILYEDKETRERIQCRYLIVDEFQDTNSNQLMIALMAAPALIMQFSRGDEKVIAVIDDSDDLPF